MRIPARNDTRASGDTCLGQSDLCLAEGQTCSECGKYISRKSAIIIFNYIYPYVYAFVEK